MKKLNNLSISFLFILLLCAIFTLLFWDVFKAKDIVSLGIKSVFWISLCIIALLIVGTKFINLSSKHIDNSVIISTIFASLISVFVVQNFIIVQKTTEFINANTKKFINPMWDEFLRIGKIYSLDLSFTKYVWEQRGPKDYLIHEIFKDKPKSVDVLIFGDSSMAWGVIPEVIEQITGK